MRGRSFALSWGFRFGSQDKVKVEKQVIKFAFERNQLRMF